ncbi:hypothetical protein K438DRAFT_1755390 [Mycena galopus ATCC 62051]|nr:hypothetical protein K438DRAFT_1755390 [Mycena galopus ATCC 62051]
MWLNCDVSTASAHDDEPTSFAIITLRACPHRIITEKLQVGVEGGGDARFWTYRQECPLWGTERTKRSTKSSPPSPERLNFSSSPRPRCNRSRDACGPEIPRFNSDNNHVSDSKSKREAFKQLSTGVDAKPALARPGRSRPSEDREEIMSVVVNSETAEPLSMLKGLPLKIWLISFAWIDPGRVNNPVHAPSSLSLVITTGGVTRTSSILSTPVRLIENLEESAGTASVH